MLPPSPLPSSPSCSSCNHCRVLKLLIDFKPHPQNVYSTNTLHLIEVDNAMHGEQANIKISSQASRKTVTWHKDKEETLPSSFCLSCILYRVLKLLINLIAPLHKAYTRFSVHYFLSLIEAKHTTHTLLPLYTS